MFLIYRVELKARKIYGRLLIETQFLIYRVELKDHNYLHPE